MKNVNVQAIVESRPADRYPEFSESVKQGFSALVGAGLPLFTTDAEGLFDLFLANLPEEARQHYTCNSCRHFVDRFGGLVSIADDGETVSVMWDETNVPEFFRLSVSALKKAVLKAKVTGVFIADKAILGTPVTGEWQHMSVTLPLGMVNRDVLKTAGQKMADRREEFVMLSRALGEYPDIIANQAIALLGSETLYRSDKVLGVAKWFGALHEKINNAFGWQRKANIKWLAVATAPAGFCHVKSSMIGTLLDDLKEGMPIDAVSRRFKEKMDPLQYMRPQSAPSAGNIQQAEKIVEKLGIANSLKRRYARFEEIPQFLWKPPVATLKTAEKTGGVFGHLTPKGTSSPEPNTINLPTTTMTWEKFQKTVLPTAESIEAKVDNPGKCMALITAADPDAPNILRWNNTVSWYYRRYASYESWNVPKNGFAKVKGITETPNMWGDAPVTHAGQQIFFLLEGCRDVSGSYGGGLFPENLKAELHEIRSTIEAYSNKAMIEDSENASACGLGFSKDNPWDLILKVTDANSTRLIKIDRWD